MAGFEAKYDAATKAWQYVDVDGKVIANWNQEANGGKGKVELAEGVTSLDFRKHEGLFVGWTPAQVEAAGSNLVPIPIDISTIPGRIENKRSLKMLLFIEGVPEGTILSSPESGKVVRPGSNVNSFVYLYGSLNYNIMFPTSSQYVGPASGEVRIGDRLVLLGPNFPPSYAAGKYIYDQASIGVTINEQTGRDITFADVLKSGNGQLVYIK